MAKIYDSSSLRDKENKIKIRIAVFEGTSYFEAFHSSKEWCNKLEWSHRNVDVAKDQFDTKGTSGRNAKVSRRETNNTEGPKDGA